MHRSLFIAVLTLAALVLTACSIGPAVSAPERILVGGATGRQGAAVVDELLARGYAVRALTRNADSDKAQALRSRGVEVVAGDYGDRESLLAAMTGIRRMFFYSGFSRNEVDEGLNVIAAASASGIARLIYSSGAAADPANGVAGSAKMQVEQALVASGVPYTVLRPVAFMENFDRQQKRFATTGITESRGPDRMLYFISLPDIGFFVGEALDDPDRWLDRGVNIASDQMTVADYVATFSRVMGRPITYTQMPLEDYLATFPKPLRPLFRWYDQVGYTADVTAFRTAYPDLTTLDGYLRATGWENWQQ